MKPICLVIAVFLLRCKTVRKEKDVVICNGDNFYQKIEKVSFDDVDQLRKHDGKFIEIEGIFHNNFEDVALYPSQSSSSAENALWINLIISDSLVNSLNRRRISVIGRVNIQHKGHLNLYLATLDSAFCVKKVVN